MLLQLGCCLKLAWDNSEGSAQGKPKNKKQKLICTGSTKAKCLPNPSTDLLACIKVGACQDSGFTKPWHETQVPGLEQSPLPEAIGIPRSGGGFFCACIYVRVVFTVCPRPPPPPPQSYVGMRLACPDFSLKGLGL